MFRFPALLVSLLLLTAPLQAATFRLGGDADLNCRMSIEGEIVAGDAERFREMLASYVASLLPDDPSVNVWDNLGAYLQDVRICLDSPGGSLSEALEMADTLAFGYRVRQEIADREPSLTSAIIWTVGTAIPAGARCDSACAILFMAGGYFSNLGTSNNLRDPNRVLHVDGHLSFDLPRLTLEDGAYSAAQVAQSFDLALETVAALTARMDRYRLPASLLQQLLATPRGGSFEIETVAQAASWSIGLAGAPRIASPSHGNLIAVCDNLQAHAAPGFDRGEQYTRLGAPADIRAETTTMFGLESPLGLPDPDFWRYGVQGDPDAPLLGQVRHDGYQCVFDYTVETGELLFEHRPPTDHGLEATGTFGSFMPGQVDEGWLLYPGYVTTDDLAALAGENGALAPSQMLPPVRDQLAGSCSRYDASDRLIGSEPCRAELLTSERADRRAQQSVLSLSWFGEAADLPSGRRDNRGALGDWAHIGPNENGSGRVGGCYRHATSRETRCFTLSEVVVEDLSAFLR